MRKGDIVHQKIKHNKLSLVCCIYCIPYPLRKPHYVIYIIYHLSITYPSTFNYSFHDMHSIETYSSAHCSYHISQPKNLPLHFTEGRPWLAKKMKQRTLFYFSFKPLKTILCHRHSFLGTVKETPRRRITVRSSVNEKISTNQLGNSLSVDISFKDDQTVILFLGVSFMRYVNC